MHGMLRAGLAAAALSVIPAADAGAASYASRTLAQGSTGSDVKALQRYLDRAGRPLAALAVNRPREVGALRRELALGLEEAA